MEGQTRLPAVAGTFYPDDRDELKQMIKKFLRGAEVKNSEVPRGMVVPHAGYIYSGQVAAFGYGELKKHAGSIDKVILIGPSHYGRFFGAVESGSDFWQSPLGLVRIGSLIEKIENKELISIAPEIHAPEHSLEVQIPFLQMVMPDDYELYPILTGDIMPSALADALTPLIDEKTFVIASSDLSHYHPYEKARKLDSIANDAVPNLKFEKLEGAEACGITGVETLMHIAKNLEWKGKMLEYKNSGDTAGDKTQVVGYGCYMFYE